MPWREKTVEKIRKEFISEAIKVDKNMSKICREFGISRKTGYKWVKRYKEENSLKDKSRKPNTISKKTLPNIEELIVRLREENPGWGAKKLRDVLVREEKEIPCTRTVSNILKRNELISKEESQKRKAYIRFEREKCNELWQSDIKGDFAMLNGRRCYPLTIIDDHSRYSIRIEAKEDIRGVTESFKQAFFEYGLPEALLTDNGSYFAGFRGGYTQFERFLMDNDVLPIHGRIMHPQTQGKIERFHRSMKEELLKYKQFKDIKEAQEQLKEWQIKYNNIRPHEALNNKRPAEVYKASERKYKEKIKSYEYSGIHHMCKVNNWGYLRYMEYRIYLSETFADTYLELQADEEQGIIKVCYRNFIIAKINPNDGKLLNRKMFRI